MLWPFKIDTVETHCAIENFLSDEECKSVIELGLSQNIQKGVTFNGENDPTRESNIAWIHATDRRADWLFRRITDAGIYVNKKLSFVIQLSNSTDYEGGDLTLHLSDDPLVIPKKKGTICFFPSYVLHEVTKVTKGQRFSVVGWITGPQFK